MNSIIQTFWNRYSFSVYLFLSENEIKAKGNIWQRIAFFASDKKQLRQVLKITKVLQKKFETFDFLLDNEKNEK